MEVYRGKVPFLLTEYKENIVYLGSSNRNIEDYYNVLGDYYQGKILRIESGETQEEREKINYEFLKTIKDEKRYIILISLEAFLKDYYEEGEKLEYSIGENLDRKELEAILLKMGYEKNYLLEKRKQYSIRGEIIDIFPITSENPIRIQLGFDDEIERITYFDIESLKSIEKLEKIKMYINNNKEKVFSFFDVLKNLKKTIFFVENKELLNYKLEELILRDRDRENVIRERFSKIDEFGENIDIKQFSHDELQEFSKYDFLKEFGENNLGKLLIFSEEEKRYKELLSKYENIEVKKYPLFEGYREENLLVLTDRELKGIRIKREAKEKLSLKYRTVSEIREGDYIIHENYGVGIYQGIEIINGNEYLKVKYAGEDKLFVPIEGISRIEKYITHNDAVPELFNLGRRKFKQKKEKLYEEMLVFAKEIVEIQAKRELNIGYRYTCDTVWQEEFEEGFPFKETESQLKAIIDVKRDMESSRIMDRVVCGDVGYGKTEVAMRAAFKAAIDGKQVAILVPTTVLAQQHFERFSQRMKNYPISIELLSRLKTEKEQKESLKKLSKGSIDIIIGTHRLLSKDVKFKDLGLVIIDEEQKFGVKAKEKLKKLRNQVDLLTLTATPIPRTLNLSLLGVRDLSVIDTPPEGRKAVLTYFIPENSDEIKEVIMKEIAREGQIFYIFNFVNGIEKKVRELKKLLPEYVKIDFVHGQMAPKEIKEKIKEFEVGDLDILVSTTILENGIDIENANTMIIDGVDKLGLSQIYQLRGRIGRGQRQGYCYLLQKDYQSQKAKEREESLLKLEEEGGGGLQLSMEDMRIRGAGEILGEKQHGALEIFGFNLYMKMLKEEIDRVKGTYVKVDNFEDIEIKVNYVAYIPDSYIEKNEKIRVYREIIEISTLEELEEYKDELIDIFGKMPVEVEGLFAYIKLKFLAREIGVKKAVENKYSCEICFDREKVDIDRLFELLSQGKIGYNNETETVTFEGSILEFFQMYKKN